MKKYCPLPDLCIPEAFTKRKGAKKPKTQVVKKDEALLKGVQLLAEVKQEEVPKQTIVAVDLAA